MKRKALVFVLITIIAVSAFAWLVHNQISELQNQISELKAQNVELQDLNKELQNQTSELKKQLNELQSKTYRGLNVTIAAFEWLGGFNPYVGLTILSDANVTVQNNEAYAISGFNLNLTLVNKSTGKALSGTAVFAIDTLHAFEIREIKGWAFWTIRDNLDNAECVVVLSLGNFVVDKKTFGGIWSPLS